METVLLRWPAVQAATGISRSHAWRMERTGQFPRRRQISTNAVGWVAQEIHAWIEARKVVPMVPAVPKGGRHEHN